MPKIILWTKTQKLRIRVKRYDNVDNLGIFFEAKLKLTLEIHENIYEYFIE